MRTRFNTRDRRAFTLIEILIVVVILGILAAIVIPQFTDASNEANESNVRSQLQTIRSQIELYNVQNPASAYDDATVLGTFWDALIAGDYLHSAPQNPLQDNSSTVADAAAAGVGWVWRAKDGGTTYTIYGVGSDDAEFVE